MIGLANAANLAQVQLTAELIFYQLLSRAAVNLADALIVELEKGKKK